MLPGHKNLGPTEAEGAVGCANLGFFEFLEVQKVADIEANEMPFDPSTSVGNFPRYTGEYEASHVPGRSLS